MQQKNPKCFRRKTELENEWTFLDQKEQAMEENVRRLVEKVAALLAEKKATLEKLEYALNDLRINGRATDESRIK